MRQRESHAGNEGMSVSVLYERYAATILNYIRYHLPSAEDAEDILLEVFAAALESDTLPYLQEGAQAAWLRRVAHNKCIDVYRRGQRRPTALSLDADDAPLLYDDERHLPDAVALQREEYSLLYERLSSLSEYQQEVLRLRFAEDMRCSDIAKHLHKRESTIRMALARALNLLRTLYEKQ